MIEILISIFWFGLFLFCALALVVGLFAVIASIADGGISPFMFVFYALAFGISIPVIAFALVVYFAEMMAHFLPIY